MMDFLLYFLSLAALTLGTLTVCGLAVRLCSRLFSALLGRGSGAVFDVAVDLRQGSRTYGRWCGVELTAENKKQFYVPEGFAHGFLVRSETAEFCYKVTDFYHPGDEGGIMWNDPEIGIDWGDVSDIILSEKDKHHPRLSEYAFAF